MPKTVEVLAVGEPPGADFQMAEVVALGQPSGAEDFLGTGQGSACARGRVPRLLLLLLLLRQGAPSFCCGLKAEVLLERGGCSSLLHAARGCPVVPIDVLPGSILLEHILLIREPRTCSAARQRSWLGWMTWQRLCYVCHFGRRARSYTTEN